MVINFSVKVMVSHGRTVAALTRVIIIIARKTTRFIVMIMTGAMAVLTILDQWNIIARMILVQVVTDPTILLLAVAVVGRTRVQHRHVIWDLVLTVGTKMVIHVVMIPIVRANPAGILVVVIWISLR